MRTADVFHLSTRCVFRCIAVGEAETKWRELIERHGLFHRSESGSEYVLDGETVYRMSDHWGRVSSCDWALEDPNAVSGELTNGGKPMLLISHRITEKRIQAIGTATLNEFKLAKRYI